MFALRHERQGLTALVTVLILGSIALLTAIVIALRGAGEVDLGLTSLQGQQADAILLGCREEALLRIQRDRRIGRDSAAQSVIGNGTCTMQTRLLPGTSLETYDVTLQAERGRSKKCASLKVIVPSMQIVSFDPLACSEVHFTASSSSS